MLDHSELVPITGEHASAVRKASTERAMNSLWSPSIRCPPCVHGDKLGAADTLRSTFGEIVGDEQIVLGVNEHGRYGERLERVVVHLGIKDIVV